MATLRVYSVLKFDVSSDIRKKLCMIFGEIMKQNSSGVALELKVNGENDMPAN